MARRRLGMHALIRRRPATQTGHVRFGPGFIKEHEARWIDLQGRLPPLFAVLAYVRPLLLAAGECLFLKVMFSLASARSTAPMLHTMPNVSYAHWRNCSSV